MRDLRGAGGDEREGDAVKPVMQTRLAPGGDCLAACFASILEIPIEGIPDFNAPGGNWFHRIEQWMEPMGLIPLPVRTPPMWGAHCHDVAYCIACGKSPRGDWSHAVVWRGGIVHDPHPDGTGLLGDPEQWVYFVAVDPAALRGPDRACG